MTRPDSTGERNAARLLAQERDRDAAQRPDRPLDVPERGPAGLDAEIPERERAAVSFWIVRSDLGPGVRTLVIAGDLVPYGFESYTRESVWT